MILPSNITPGRTGGKRKCSPFGVSISVLAAVLSELGHCTSPWSYRYSVLQRNRAGGLRPPSVPADLCNYMKIGCLALAAAVLLRPPRLERESAWITLAVGLTIAQASDTIADSNTYWCHAAATSSALKSDGIRLATFKPSGNATMAPITPGNSMARATISLGVPQRLEKSVAGLCARLYSVSSTVGASARRSRYSSLREARRTVPKNSTSAPSCCGTSCTGRQLEVPIDKVIYHFPGVHLERVPLASSTTPT